MCIQKALILFLSVSCAATGLAWADFTFQGNLDIPKKELEVSLDIPQVSSEKSDEIKSLDETGSVLIKAQQMPGGEFHFSFDVGHLKTPQFYFSGNIEGIVQILNQENSNGGLIEGHWWGEKPSINFETVDKFTGDFKVVNQKLYLKSFALGDVLGRGYLELNPPYKMDFDVSLYSISMNDFLSFWMKTKEESSKGDVSGKIKITGGLDHLALQGKLASFKGFVRQLQYDSLYLDAEGVYPHLTINEHSTISKSDGLSYSFAGQVDLNDAENFKNQLKKLKISPLVSTSKSEMEWTIKRLEEGDASTEIKYLLRQDADHPSNENSDMLGVERSLKF